MMNSTGVASLASSAARGRSSRQVRKRRSRGVVPCETASTGWRQAERNQAGRNFRNIGEPHIDDEGRLGIGEARPVEFERLVGLAVAGDVADAARKSAMGQRDVRRRGAALRRRDPRHDLERYTGALERLGFLAAAAEDERVAALEPDHGASGAGEPHQHAVDLRLRHAMMARLLADIDAGRPLGNKAEYFRRDQPIIDHDIGSADDAGRLEGEQLGIARPRPHEKDFSSAHRFVRRLDAGDGDGAARRLRAVRQ